VDLNSERRYTYAASRTEEKWRHTSLTDSTTYVLLSVRDDTNVPNFELFQLMHILLLL